MACGERPRSFGRQPRRPTPATPASPGWARRRHRRTGTARRPQRQHPPHRARSPRSAAGPRRTRSTPPCRARPPARRRPGPGRGPHPSRFPPSAPAARRRPWPRRPPDPGSDRRSRSFYDASGPAYGCRQAKRRPNFKGAASRTKMAKSQPSHGARSRRGVRNRSAWSRGIVSLTATIAKAPSPLREAAAVASLQAA